MKLLAKRQMLQSLDTLAQGKCFNAPSVYMDIFSLWHKDEFIISQHEK